MPCLISGSDVLLSSTVCTLRGKISATDPTGVVEILFPPQVKGLMGETRPPAGILEHGRGIPKLSNPHAVSYTHLDVYKRQSCVAAAAAIAAPVPHSA